MLFLGLSLPARICNNDRDNLRTILSSRICICQKHQRIGHPVATHSYRLFVLLSAQLSPSLQGKLTIQLCELRPAIVKYRSLLLSAWGILRAKDTLPSLLTNPEELTVDTAKTVGTTETRQQLVSISTVSAGAKHERTHQAQAQ